MNLVLIVADSVRADMLGCDGGACLTPTIDKLASEGIRFERVISAAPWTVPSLASMLTGVTPHRLGLAKWEQPWPRDIDSLFRAATRSGLDVSSFVFDPGYLFSRVPEAGVAGSSQNTELLLDWLKTRRKGSAKPPFFCFLHYWWTHIPYIATPMSPSSWRQATDRVLDAMRASPKAREGVKALYRHGIQHFSEVWLPRLLEVLDLEQTWIVITADHGESWGERPGTEIQDVFDLHGHTLYDEVLRVPLIIRPPGGAPERVIEELTRTIDLAPTIAELLELDFDSELLDGVSLARSVLHGDPVPRLEALSAMNVDCLKQPEPPSDPAELWTALSLTTESLKLIWRHADDQRQAFDLASDPGETRDISIARARELDSYWGRLGDELARARMTEMHPDDVELLRAQLRALGYL